MIDKKPFVKGCGWTPPMPCRPELISCELVPIKVVVNLDDPEDDAAFVKWCVENQEKHKQMKLDYDTQMERETQRERGMSVAAYERELLVKELVENNPIYRAANWCILKLDKFITYLEKRYTE